MYNNDADDSRGKNVSFTLNKPKKKKTEEN